MYWWVMTDMDTHGSLECILFNKNMAISIYDMLKIFLKQFKV